MKKNDFITSCGILFASVGLLLWVYLLTITPTSQPARLSFVQRLHIVGLLCFSGGLVCALTAIAQNKLHTASVNPRRDQIALLVGVVSLLGLFCSFGLTGGKGIAVSSVNTCVNNLRALEKTTEEIALERHLERGAIVSEAEIARRFDGKIPKCPEGGIYSYGVVGKPPSCSLPEHTVK